MLHCAMSRPLLFLGCSRVAAAYRFIFDSRDEAASERLKIVSQASSAARCHAACLFKVWEK